jgi:DNA repair protein RecO (recombination protein O)
MESLQPAYVLHTRDYRDTSLLVEFFTPLHGRVSTVAKGARSARRGSSQRAILQPFQPLLVDIGGHAELKYLRHVETRASAFVLQGKTLFSAFYLNELLCRLLHRDDAHDELFADYENTLRALVQPDFLDVALRRFELRLLEELGYGFDLAYAVDSDAPIAVDRFYQYDAQRGLVAGNPAHPRAVSGRDILDFLAGNYSPAARRALKNLCRQALRPHLGDKPLHSRGLFITDR